MIKIKILLAALNSKYIHTSLALRSLVAYTKDYEKYLTIKEFTINNREDFITSEIYKSTPDVICFSCYIWNIEMIKSICSTLKKIMPKAIIVLGGPEVSYEIDFPSLNCDIVIKGEGESSFKELVAAFIKGDTISNIKGILFLENEILMDTGNGDALSLDEIPFVYDEIGDLSNRILYYETSRGCPFNCQYCLSSVEKGVRFLSRGRVESDLSYFLKNRPRQVKFVDRTFNCNRDHAIHIWEYLIQNDNGYTNFHFEISADLLTDEMISVLKKARAGFFQLEIGVQSTNDDTLSTIKRKTNLKSLFQKVSEIKSFKNIHQHLDLIVGLPEEGYESFKNSFNEVYVLKGDMLQIGFLKLLRGSGLRRDAEKLGIIFNEKAPYEVLFTNNLNYNEFLRLKMIEEIFEIYYNSNKFKNTLNYIAEINNNPFEFYEKLSIYWESHQLHSISHNKFELFNILYEFLVEEHGEHEPIFKELLKFDMYLNENIKKVPKWASMTDYLLIKNEINDFYQNEENMEKYFKNLKDYTTIQISRMCHIEAFNMNMEEYIKTNKIIMGKHYILFNYYDKEVLSNDAKFYAIDL